MTRRSLGSPSVREPLQHKRFPAIELDFYIPASIWRRRPTRLLLETVYALVHGATIVGNARGIWRGDVESTNIVRILVRRHEFQERRMARRLQLAVDQAMRSWAATPGRQKVVVFTVRHVMVVQTSLPH